MATKTRSTIGQNPLDAVVPNLSARPNASAQSKETSRKTTPKDADVETPSDSTRKERLTIHLSQGLIERLKNAVYWTPGLTLAELGETGLTHLVNELEAERGTPFEPRTGELKGGRPLKRP